MNTSSNMEIVGELNEREFIFEWKIKDFLSLAVEDGSSYNSPLFDFANASWCLCIYPNGLEEAESQGFIDLYLFRKTPGLPISLEYSFGVKTEDKKLDNEKHFLYTFKGIEGYGYVVLLSRMELLERKSDLLPSDTLTLVCRMKDPKFTEFANYDVLCQDFKKILLDGKNHDLTLKVGDKELRAHQDVLMARSPVFESMLSHDMAEKQSSVINIPDCNPQAMEQFLLYVYSGKVETLDQTNMLQLYYIADKYDMFSLKRKCCDFIQDSLSLTNICEVIQLALNHSDTSLLDFATEYFMDNTVNILLTVEWQSFLKDNTTVGNELLIKSFRKVNNSKN